MPMSARGGGGAATARDRPPGGERGASGGLLGGRVCTGPRNARLHGPSAEANQRTVSRPQGRPGPCVLIPPGTSLLPSLASPPLRGHGSPPGRGPWSASDPLPSRPAGSMGKGICEQLEGVLGKWPGADGRPLPASPSQERCSLYCPPRRRGDRRPRGLPPTPAALGPGKGHVFLRFVKNASTRRESQ